MWTLLCEKFRPNVQPFSCLVLYTNKSFRESCVWNSSEARESSILFFWNTEVSTGMGTVMAWSYFFWKIMKISRAFQKFASQSSGLCHLFVVVFDNSKGAFWICSKCWQFFCFCFFGTGICKSQHRTCWKHECAYFVFGRSLSMCKVKQQKKMPLRVP